MMIALKLELRIWLLVGHQIGDGPGGVSNIVPYGHIGMLVVLIDGRHPCIQKVDDVADLKIADRAACSQVARVGQLQCRVGTPECDIVGEAAAVDDFSAVGIDCRIVGEAVVEDILNTAVDDRPIGRAELADIFDAAGIDQRAICDAAVADIFDAAVVDRRGEVRAAVIDIFDAPVVDRCAGGDPRTFSMPPPSMVVLTDVPESFSTPP
jgi:hypothetical protein